MATAISGFVSEVVHECRQGLERLYGSRLVGLVLFGSRARGDARADSDIDLLVILRPPVRSGEEILRTGPLLQELCLRHEVLVSCLFPTEDEYANRQSPLLMNVRREGVPV
jgi:uncharacterized protein